MKPSSPVMTVMTNLTRRGSVLVRAAIAATAVCFPSIGLSESDTTIRKETRIPAEELAVALRALEKDRSLELIYFGEDVRGRHTRGAAGNLTVDEALTQILAGTGLTYQHVDHKTVTIVPAPNPARTPSVPQQLSDRPPPPRPIEEVVVTAQKRKEGMQDVPVSMSVIDGARLEELGSLELADYAGYVGGLSVVQGPAPGTDMLVVRGLNSPSPNALVGTYIDDTPVSASAGEPESARHALDLLPYDFDRIEVLEGPQGTLYGANAMGGLLKYVTRKPDPDRVTLGVGANLKENNDASAIGWDAHSELNLPIAAGQAALRASLVSDVVPGFIDEPEQHRSNSNQVSDQAGHLALLFGAAASWSVTLSALLQHRHSNDGALVTLSPAFAPDVGRLSTSQQVPWSSDSRLQYYSASINGELRWANFVSATSYSRTSSSEFEQAYTKLDTLTGRADSGIELSLHKLTQELRLVSPSGSALEWLLGAFYTDERGTQLESAYALNTDNTAVQDPQLNPLLHVFAPSRYREYALFGDITWKPTHALDLTAGLRESRNEQHFAGIPVCSAMFDLQLQPCAPSSPPSHSHQNVFNFTLSPAYHFSSAVMAYVRVASGYRPGGPNVPSPGVPRTIKADTLINSEVGLKSNWLDHKLQFDAAIYQIDWKHIQILATAPPPFNVTYGANANDAIVRGLEASMILAPVSNIRLGLNLNYLHAVLADDMPAASQLVGRRGDRLPYAPIWSGALTGDYTHQLQHGWTVAVGAGWRYTGQRYTTINNPGNCPARCAGADVVPDLRPYGILDLHAGVSNDSWSVRLIVHNVTDKYAVVDLAGGGGPSYDPTAVVATVLHPRLFTLGVDRRF